MLAIFSLPSGAEWIVILIIALLLFGNRLPSVMRSLGKGISEFKKGMRDQDTEDEKESGASSPAESPEAESKKKAQQ